MATKKAGSKTRSRTVTSSSAKPVRAKRPAEKPPGEVSPFSEMGAEDESVSDANGSSGKADAHSRSGK